MDAVVKPLRKAPLCDASLSDHVKSAAPALLNLVRLRSGGLPDDVGIVLLRIIYD